MSIPHLVLGLHLPFSLFAFPVVHSQSVNIADTDDVREVCQGMYGGKKAYIERECQQMCSYAAPCSSPVYMYILTPVSFDQRSSGQVALVIYEWKDVKYLGVESPDDAVGASSSSVPVRMRMASGAARGQVGR